jgi:hypothetical protein
MEAIANEAKTTFKKEKNVFYQERDFKIQEEQKPFMAQ